MNRCPLALIQVPEGDIDPQDFQCTVQALAPYTFATGEEKIYSSDALDVHAQLDGIGGFRQLTFVHGACLGTAGDGGAATPATWKLKFSWQALKMFGSCQHARAARPTG